MVLMSGVQPASVIRQSCTKRSGEYEKSYGRRPALAVVLVGDNPSSRSYVRTKRRACEQVGIDHRDFFLDSSVSQEALLELVAGLNADDSVDGVEEVLLGDGLAVMACGNQGGLVADVGDVGTREAWCLPGEEVDVEA